MNLKNIALFCALASVCAPFSIRAGDTQSANASVDTARLRAQYPELQVLTPEEQAKFTAASAATKKDPKLQEAQRKVLAAIEELRRSVEASMIAVDPSMESILKKLKEARDQARANGAPRAAQ